MKTSLNLTRPNAGLTVFLELNFSNYPSGCHIFTFIKGAHSWAVHFEIIDILNKSRLYNFLYIKESVIIKRKNMLL